MSEVTSILNAAAGDAQAAAQHLPLVHDELRRLAAQKLAREAPGQTLQATSLIHEAYLLLVGPADVACWRDRGHFFAAAAPAMRNILVDSVRRKQSEKRGGDRQRVELGEDPPAPLAEAEELLALDEALTRLAAVDPEAPALVQLRYFGGLSVEKAAQSRGISRAVAYRLWTAARAQLLSELAGDESI
jgi:RNA polymerase sigma factor (TIGR02999 family)